MLVHGEGEKMKFLKGKIKASRLIPFVLFFRIFVTLAAGGKNEDLG